MHYKTLLEFNKVTMKHHRISPGFNLFFALTGGCQDPEIRITIEV